MLTQTEISLLKKGDRVDHFFILRKIEVRLTRGGKKYLWLELADRTCTLTSNLWDNFDFIYAEFKPGDTVKVEGTIDEYMGTLQVKISLIRRTVSSDGISFTDLINKSNRDVSVMISELTGRIQLISDVWLRNLMQLIFDDENLNKFSTAPAGKAWHHSYIHGLIEHTLEIMRICDLMSDIHPEINRDLLICGAILHDFGKIEELKYDSSFEYTDKGKLIGHIVISAIIIHDYTKKIPGFPDDIKNCLMHLVLSHQGKLEFASPVVPKTVEAIVLYQADELSAKVNAYKSAINNDANSESKWTKYLSLISTDLYKNTIRSESPEVKINNTLFD